ncbi:MAG: WecB/TagA/CpsF family glycosyltransferase [Proteobacteria bacterium]|nr:WecB/TagA/CpsF family glycosyltransferase [Pseudomonadota bacterium]
MAGSQRASAPAPGPLPSGRRCSVLGMRVDELDYDRVINQIRVWSAEGSSHYMCISTVHMVMESYDDPGFQAVVNAADLVGADGIPVIKVSRWLGLGRQGRVFAPELLIRLSEVAANEGIPVGFYGSTPKVIEDLVGAVSAKFPKLNVAYSLSPPFRALSPEELDKIADDINRSGVRILFVGLGCPKQERWMNQMRGKVNATMIGVGWAFDVCSGHSKAAPEFIQNAGMEWFYRLVLNPKKLWRRHLRNNPRFLVLIGRQLVSHKPA